VTKVSLQNVGGSHRHPSLPQYERSEADLYTTPFEPVQRLYAARQALKNTFVWDSSAGLGHIVDAIHKCGGPVVGSDLHDHPFPKVAPLSVGVDLFSFTRLDVPAYTCVVNPPYKQARQHIRHMLDLGCEVYALLRVNFLTGKRVQPLFPHWRALLLVGRVGMLPPGVEDKGMSPQIDYGWFHFTPEKKADSCVVVERI
jgi:hypothetical protein